MNTALIPPAPPGTSPGGSPIAVRWVPLRYGGLQGGIHRRGIFPEIRRRTKESAENDIVRPGTPGKT